MTLDVECVSTDEACNWVDTSVDRVVLNRNSFTEKTVAVSGEVPEGFAEEAPVRFSIKASDPRANGSSSDLGVAYVDFTVTNSPVLGPALDVALKMFDTREVESPVSWGHPVSIPFIIFPALLMVLFWTGWWAVEYVSPMKERPDARAVVSVLVFLVFFILL